MLDEDEKSQVKRLQLSLDLAWFCDENRARELFFKDGHMTRCLFNVYDVQVYNCNGDAVYDIVNEKDYAKIRMLIFQMSKVLERKKSSTPLLSRKVELQFNTELYTPALRDVLRGDLWLQSMRKYNRKKWRHRHKAHVDKKSPRKSVTQKSVAAFLSFSLLFVFPVTLILYCAHRIMHCMLCGK